MDNMVQCSRIPTYLHKIYMIYLEWNYSMHSAHTGTVQTPQIYRVLLLPALSPTVIGKLCFRFLWITYLHLNLKFGAHCVYFYVLLLVPLQRVDLFYFYLLQLYLISNWLQLNFWLLEGLSFWYIRNMFELLAFFVFGIYIMFFIAIRN